MTAARNSAWLRTSIEASLGDRFPSALTFRPRPAPQVFSTGLPELDAVTGGIPRGGLTEICGPASCGRTSLLLALLAEVTRRQEVCALVDGSDTFDPTAAVAAGVDLRRVLWVRCSAGSAEWARSAGSVRSAGSDRPARTSPSGAAATPKPPGADATRKMTLHSVPGLAKLGLAKKSLAKKGAVEQAMQVTDLLLQSGGFGLIALDFCDIAPATARRVSLTSWFRFRRAVENTPTALIVMEQESNAGACASLVLDMGQKEVQWSRAASHGAALLGGLDVSVNVARALNKDKRQPVRAGFESRAGWLGLCG